MMAPSTTGKITTRQQAVDFLNTIKTEYISTLSSAKKTGTNVKEQIYNRSQLLEYVKSAGIPAPTGKPEIALTLQKFILQLCQKYELPCPSFPNIE